MRRRRRCGAVGPALLAGLLAVGCAANGVVRKDEAGGERARPELRQAIEALQRELAELRIQLQAEQAVQREALAGLRAEVLAVQAAFQALVRDADQRQLEGLQAIDRQLVAVGRRVDELVGAVQRAEAVAVELRQRLGPVETPAPAPEAPGEAPPPAVPARASRIQRVSPAEAASETRVSVEADGPLSPRAFTLTDPARLIVDFENAAFGFDRTPVAVGGPIVDRIRFIQLRATPTPVIRLVLGLTRPVPFWIEPQPHGLVLHLGASGPPR